MGWTFGIKYDVQAWHFELVSAKPHPPRYMLTTAYGLNFALIFSYGTLRVSVLTSCCSALMRQSSYLRTATLAPESSQLLCLKCGREEPNASLRSTAPSAWAPGQALPDNLVAALDSYFNPLDAAMEAGTLLMVLESLAALTPKDRRMPSLWRTLRYKRVLQEVLTL